MASISSMKMMAPLRPSFTIFSLARSKASRISFAPSPMYICTSWGPASFKKIASVFFAQARASKVLPVPGGPYSSTPFGALIPTRTNNSGLVRGNSITSRSSRIWSFKPPISEKSIFFDSSVSMLKTVGSTSRGIGLIIVKVVISRATLVPCFSLLLSSFVLQPTTYRGPEEALTMKRSSSICFRTSPMSIPTLWIAFRSSSVRLYSKTKSRTSCLIFFTFASTSKCSLILLR
mmetsp:Transcript_37297/g.64459  ORF Transcript_37297/g.64459 Transcript_37297/m.64459 type:complete len:233 (+) Transcript_37297:77-775(+)